MNSTKHFFTIILSLLLTACAAAPSTLAALPTQALTHIPYEGELEQTDAFIPYNTITQNLEQLPADKNEPIVLYCMSGGMSTTAAKELVLASYTNVWELSGGMWAWEAAGFEIVRLRR